MRYIRNNFITEKIIKLPDQAKARRFFNYPYIAIEEALVNAVYHRSYEIREPIEVRVNLDKIEILNFPGPDPSISADALKRERIETNEDRTYFLIEFHIHPEMAVLEMMGKAQVEVHVKAQDEAHDQAQVILSETEFKILNICQKNAVRNKEILTLLGHKSLSGHLKKSLKHLQEIGAIVYTIPEKPRSRNQQYKITAKGMRLLIDLNSRN